jgi:hypothetical protein
MAVQIDLAGPEGNAFALMGIAKGFCKQLGKDFKPILEEMRSGDYENLVAVFKREFKHVADVFNSNDEHDEEDWDD